MKLVYDCETTRFPDGNPYRETNEMVSAAFLVGGTGDVSSTYCRDADFTGRLRTEISRATLLILINGKFDIAWARRYGISVPKGCRVWDCQIAEYVLSGQTNSFASMDELCLRYNLPGKQGGLEDYWDKGIDTVDIPREVVLDYNLGDVRRTWSIYEAQLKDERMTPAMHKLILLMGADLLVLQRMEEYGLKYDVERSKAEGEKLKEELLAANHELDSYAGNVADFNWDSGDHLSAFLYGGSISIDVFEPTTLVYKSGPRKGQEYVQNKFKETKVYEYRGLFRPLPRTHIKKSLGEDGKPDLSLPQYYQTNEPVLKQLRATSAKQKRIVELLLKRAELAKLVDTYFLKLPQRIDEMGWGDIVHGTYNQVVARTGRLSSSAPNMQNNPAVVDRMFISRYND
jgi:DNA polymerase I-like protein with 3'-5' exonuclease and polymerase domains